MGQIATPFVLSEADQTTLNNLVGKGKEGPPVRSVRKLNRVIALQFSHQGQHPEQISNLLGISVATVYNLRKHYSEDGLERAISEQARPGQPRKVTQQVDAQINQPACSVAPDSRTRWTAALINERLDQEVYARLSLLVHLGGISSRYD